MVNGAGRSLIWLEYMLQFEWILLEMWSEIYVYSIQSAYPSSHYKAMSRNYSMQMPENWLRASHPDTVLRGDCAWAACCTMCCEWNLSTNVDNFLAIHWYTRNMDFLTVLRCCISDNGCKYWIILVLVQISWKKILFYNVSRYQFHEASGG